MNLEKEVCALEYSKRLKELGVNHDSLYSYILSEYQVINGKASENQIVLTYSNVSNSPNKWNAYTSAELFQIIPYFIDTKNNEPFNCFRFMMTRHLIVEKNEFPITPNIVFRVNYHCETMEGNQDPYQFIPLRLIQKPIYDINLANCLAKLLIYLLEEGFITIENINKFKYQILNLEMTVE